MNASKIPIACDKCGKKFGVDAALVGRAVKCPCGNVLKVVAKEQAATASVSTGATAQAATAAKPAAVKPAAPRQAAPKPQAQTAQAQTAQPPNTPKVAAPKAAVPAIQNNFLDQLTEADFNRKAVNPFSPPSSSNSDAAALRKFGVVDDEIHAAAKAASGNITFLAVLNFIGAGMYIVAGVLLLALTSILGTLADVLPIAALGALAAAVLICMGIFDLASGIGLIQRTKWGWWLCVLGLSWAFFDRGAGIAVQFMFAADPTTVIPKAIGGVLFMLSSLYFLNFMCQQSTMKMFKLKVHSGLVWGIAITFGLALGGVSFGAALYGMRQVAAGG